MQWSSWWGDYPIFLCLCLHYTVINNYGPTLYASLGFSPVKQLLYPAAWLVFALGMNIAGMFLVDRFNRPRYMAFGVVSVRCNFFYHLLTLIGWVHDDIDH